jgi:hypothetical protein
MYIYIFGSIALEVTVWFVPSLIGNAVAISIIGLVFGAFFWSLMSVF